MYIKTIVSVDGINTVDFSGSANRFYWFHNIGTTTVYVSDRENAIAGNDGVAELSAGNTVCIETEKDRVYILGSGKVEIHNTRSKLCPFKSAPVANNGDGGNKCINFGTLETSGILLEIENIGELIEEE